MPGCHHVGWRNIWGIRHWFYILIWYKRRWPDASLLWFWWRSLIRNSTLWRFVCINKLYVYPISVPWKIVVTKRKDIAFSCLLPLCLLHLCLLGTVLCCLIFFPVFGHSIYFSCISLRKAIVFWMFYVRGLGMKCVFYVVSYFNFELLIGWLLLYCLFFKATGIWNRCMPQALPVFHNVTETEFYSWDTDP